VKTTSTEGERSVDKEKKRVRFHITVEEVEDEGKK
jgi:hypothetical protein